MLSIFYLHWIRSFDGMWARRQVSWMIRFREVLCVFCEAGFCQWTRRSIEIGLWIRRISFDVQMVIAAYKTNWVIVLFFHVHWAGSFDGRLIECWTIGLIWFRHADRVIGQQWFWWRNGRRIKRSISIFRIFGNILTYDFFRIVSFFSLKSQRQIIAIWFMMLLQFDTSTSYTTCDGCSSGFCSSSRTSFSERASGFISQRSLSLLVFNFI